MNPIQAHHVMSLTTPSDREIVMLREFDATRTAVFDAFTKSELIRRWLLGPDGWSMPVCEVDLRVGGTFRYRWRSDADGTEFGMIGTFRAVEPPERLVHVEGFEEAWYSGEALVETTFVERDATTTVTMSVRYESREARDGALASGMDRGVVASYDRLAGILGTR